MERFPWPTTLKKSADSLSSFATRGILSDDTEVRLSNQINLR